MSYRKYYFSTQHLVKKYVMTENAHTRKLATIRTVSDVSPIPGADRIVTVTVDGWQCIVQAHDMIKVGDPVVYFEIDSFIPIKPEYEFLRAKCHKEVPGLGEGFRLRTIKLRGQVSQGLVLRPSDVPGLPADWKVGDDVTEVLGVQRYEKPIPQSLRGLIKGNFPSFLRKTDQERIQNVAMKAFQAVQEGELFWMSLKLDGSSTTVFDWQGVQGVCSRNLELKLEDETNLFVRTVKASGLLEKIAGQNLAVQMELVGPACNGNWENLTEYRLYIFDIWDIQKQEYVDYATFNYFLSSLKLVDGQKVFQAPDLGFFDFAGLNTAQDMNVALLKQADVTRSVNNPAAEGIVLRSTTSGMSFKAISNKYLLLKHE